MIPGNHCEPAADWHLLQSGSEPLECSAAARPQQREAGIEGDVWVL